MSGLNTVLKSLVTPSLAKQGEQRSSSWSSLTSLFSGTGTTAINANTALTIPAYYCGVNQIANDIAKLPKGVYQKKDGSRNPLDNNIKFIINKEASPAMDAFSFHFVMELAALHRGNGVALIIRNEAGEVASLFFVYPDDIRDIVLFENKVYYLTKYGTFSQEEVIHIMGFTDNGYKGKSVIQYAAETLGIAKASQTFTKENFENRGLGFGSVETEKEINPEKKKTIEAAINTKLTAPGKIKTVMLDEGMTYKPIKLNMQEAQLIEQASFSVLDIARFLNISPRKLKDLTKDSYSSAYQEGIAHVLDCIQPRVRKWELEYDRKLFNPTQKKDNIYTKFNLNYLLQADLAMKGEYYSKMSFAGIMTRNEIRALEEMNDLPGLNEPLTPQQVKLPAEIDKQLQDGK